MFQIIKTKNYQHTEALIPTDNIYYLYFETIVALYNLNKCHVGTTHENNNSLHSAPANDLFLGAMMLL